MMQRILGSVLIIVLLALILILAFGMLEPHALAGLAAFSIAALILVALSSAMTAPGRRRSTNPVGIAFSGAMSVVLGVMMATMLMLGLRRETPMAAAMT